jgi:hypothetical protein
LFLNFISGLSLIFAAIATGIIIYITWKK